MAAKKKSQRRTPNKGPAPASTKKRALDATQSGSAAARTADSRSTTARPKAEAIVFDEDFSARVVDTVQTILLVLSLEGKIVWFNGFFATLTGYALGEVRGSDWFDTFLPTRDRPRIRKIFGQSLAGERTLGNTNAIVTKEGAERTIEWYDAPLTDSAGRITGLLSSGHDITERIEAAKALADQGARLSAILKTAAEGIITIDELGRIESVNAAAEQIFGYGTEELLGNNVSMLMPSPDAERHDDYIRRYVTSGQARIIGRGREVVGLRKDGSVFPMDLAISEVLDDKRLFTGLIRDISDRKHLESEVLSASIREQRRIGQELHDGLGQELTGLALLAQSLQARLCASGAGEAEIAADVAQGLRRALAQTRALARGLVPVQVDAGGLMVALEQLAENTRQRAGIDCRFEYDRPARIDDNNVATQLFRIAQEAVTNAVRHSRAERVIVGLNEPSPHDEHIVVRLASDDKHIALYVVDDGIGFEERQVSSSGMGLKIMRYRAQMIGGSLRITPAATGGTEVRCTLRIPSTSE